MSTVTTTPLPQAATLDATTRILRIPASAAGQTFGYFDAAGKFVPLVYLAVPGGAAPTNYVTTDTAQTGIAAKTFAGDVTAPAFHGEGGGLTIAGAAPAYNTPTKLAQAFAAVMAGADGAMDTFIEAYARFLQDEQVAAQINARLAQLQTTDGLNEGSTNKYYTDARVNTFFQDYYAEFQGISPIISPFSSAVASSGLEVGPNSLNVYRDTSASTIALTLPTNHLLPGYAASDYGCYVELSYPAFDGGVVTFNLQNGAKVDTQSTLMLYPGDFVRLARPSATAGGSQKNFVTVSITNRTYTNSAASTIGLFIPTVALEPGARVTGSVMYRLASTGETWIKQPSGNTYKIALS